MNVLFRIWYRLHCVFGKHSIVYGFTDITPLGGETVTYKMPPRCFVCRKKMPDVD